MPARRSKGRVQHSVVDKAAALLIPAGDTSTQDVTERHTRSSTDENCRRSSGIALIAGLGPEDSIYSRDAENIATEVKANGWDTVLCISPEAKKEDIHAALVTLHSKAWPGCPCMLYFGAHADVNAAGELSILPVGQEKLKMSCPTCGHKSLKASCRKCGTSLERQGAPIGISFEWLRKQVTGLPVQQVLLLVDFCFSGQIV